MVYGGDSFCTCQPGMQYPRAFQIPPQADVLCAWKSVSSKVGTRLFRPYRLDCIKGTQLVNTASCRDRILIYIF